MVKSVYVEINVYFKVSAGLTLLIDFS